MDLDGPAFEQITSATPVIEIEGEHALLPSLLMLIWHQGPTYVWLLAAVAAAAAAHVLFHWAR